jgi:hypothetical protein
MREFTTASMRAARAESESRAAASWRVFEPSVPDRARMLVTTCGGGASRQALSASSAARVLEVVDMKPVRCLGYSVKESTFPP